MAVPTPKPSVYLGLRSLYVVVYSKNSYIVCICILFIGRGLVAGTAVVPTYLHLLRATRLLLDYWVRYNGNVDWVLLVNTNPEEGGHYASGKESEGSR